jgi:hypothetical protein
MDNFNLSSEEVEIIFSNWLNGEYGFINGLPSDEEFYPVTLKLFKEQIQTDYPLGLRNIPNKIMIFQESKTNNYKLDEAFLLKPDFITKEKLNPIGYDITENSFIMVFETTFDQIDILKTILSRLIDTFEELLFLKKETNLILVDKFSVLDIEKIQYYDLCRANHSIKKYKHHTDNIIFFGNSGTGKSHRVTEKVKKAGFTEYKVTFHPEYDYANFVGAYKPFTDPDKRITYQFVPQAFIKAYVAAWKNLDKPYCLTIEEINRGNCAAIFGDIFQLLDRDKTGFSQYTIHADTDIANYLKQELAETEYALHIETLCAEREMADCENPYEILCLPPNLSLFATMNTSDQSLFPMDSAFKRRWQWQYVPIDYADAEQFTLKIGDKNYNWSNFLHTINNKIYNITESEDKQMGNRFVNPHETEIISNGYLGTTTIKEKIIDEDVFVNKVLFYLWFDIFKNEDNRNANYIFKTPDNQLLKYVELFLPDGKPNITKVEQFLEYNKIAII